MAGIEDSAARAERVAADAALASAIERDGIGPFVDRWEALPIWDSQRTLDASARGALRMQRLGNDPRGLANSLRGAGQGALPPLGGALARVDAPALIVTGALDAKYVALGRSLERDLPGARLAVVAGAGHAVHVERPRELLQIVLEFLDRR